jgi:hypothetical protein
MSRTQPTPGNPPGHLPKPPGKVARFQQFAAVQKAPPRTSADAATCHSPDPGGGGPRSVRAPRGISLPPVMRTNASFTSVMVPFMCVTQLTLFQSLYREVNQNTPEIKHLTKT